MFKFLTDNPEIYDDLYNEVMPFDSSNYDLLVEHSCRSTQTQYINKIIISQGGDRKEYIFTAPIADADSSLKKMKYYKRAAKTAVYSAMKQFTGKSLPWGSLTGIRPTYLAYEYLSDGGDIRNLTEYLENTFDVSHKRAVLASEIVSAQRNYLTDDEKAVNLYIHIPFCPSKCAYCSFTSLDYGKAKKLVDPYIDLLIEEIADAMDIIAENGFKIDSVYIGGGTPTSLNPTQLNRLLDAIDVRGCEYTLEAGRPDTITREALKICKDHGVTRISVNPQSLDEKVLAAIGRNHDRSMFYSAFQLARDFGFTINTDLIMGLPMQTRESAMADIKAIASLRPENITVHTMSIKNGSKIKNTLVYPENVETEAMMNFAIDYLKEQKYLPYYLYRQKNMLGNLENIGFTLNGYQCINNITTMEERLSVIACGAGAISKRVFKEGRIERLPNIRDVALYLERGNERFSKKRIFYSNQFTF